MTWPFIQAEPCTAAELPIEGLVIVTVEDDLELVQRQVSSDIEGSTPEGMHYALQLERHVPGASNWMERDSYLEISRKLEAKMEERFLFGEL